MSKVGHYLQEHLTGEVVASPDARRYFSTDASIFTVPPALVVYPHDENDVRKIARFSWQLAERERVIPLTARGLGTDLSGAAIGSGVVVAFPAHMNRIVELDGKSGTVTVEPGINYGKLQQTLMTHGRFLPAYPASLEYSTVGGAVANNAAGEKSVKYGDTRAAVRSLRVVLANGEVIQTGRLTKRELNKKLGQATFEGEIYRGIDTLFEEKGDAIKKFALPVTKNNAGYHLADVKGDDGSIDLTSLIVGSQGTLGLVTEITLDSEPHNPETTLFAVSFDSAKDAQAAINELREQKTLPSSMEMIDGYLLEQVRLTNPNKLKTLIQAPFPGVVMLVEFDDSGAKLKRLVKNAKKVFDKHASGYQEETELDQQTKLWKLRHLSSAVASRSTGRNQALPIIDDGIVPPKKFSQFIEGLYALCRRHRLPAAVWGRAGEANLRFQPHFDLSQVGDRQSMVKVLNDYYKLVISLGGSTTGEYGDGRLRAPFLKQLYGEEMYNIFEKVKNIFDPYGIMNPGVKLGVDIKEMMSQVDNSYSHGHRHDHLPRS